MILGLKRNEVKLADHNPEWDKIAAKTIERLWGVFGSAAIDIQHYGSTSIKTIKAKPELAIGVGVKSLDVLDELLPRLEEIGISKAENQSTPDIVLCSITAENESGVHTQMVTIQEFGSVSWQDDINFRNYMNDFPHKAAEYENLKICLAEQYPNDRKAYKNGKIAFFERIFIEARRYYDI